MVISFELQYKFSKSDTDSNGPRIKLSEGPYSNFHSKTRLWRQIDKNLNNLSVTKDMLFVTGI